MFEPIIPLVNVPMGPGSQEEGDLVLDYMKMPSEMNTYDIPILPEAEDLQSCPQAVAVMEKLQQMLTLYRVGEPTQVMPLDALPAEDLDMLNQILGEGEVSILVQGDQRTQIQETVMAGVWRLRQLNAQGELLQELLEVADIPALVRQMAFPHTHKINPARDSLPLGVLNAPSVLVEIAEASEKYLAGELTEVHVINLSLLPFSPEDHNHLGEQLGSGPVAILSRGYGNCRIGSTQVAGVWRVQYFNSTDQMILDTLEITDIPQVACAAQEDLCDSTERLHEIREVLV